MFGACVSLDDVGVVAALVVLTSVAVCNLTFVVIYCSDLQHLYSALASLSQPAQVRSMYRDTSTCGTAAGECSDVKRWVATVMDCK